MKDRRLTWVTGGRKRREDGGQEGGREGRQWLGTCRAPVYILTQCVGELQLGARFPPKYPTHTPASPSALRCPSITPPQCFVRSSQHRMHCVRRTLFFRALLTYYARVHSLSLRSGRNATPGLRNPPLGIAYVIFFCWGCPLSATAFPVCVTAGKCLRCYHKSPHPAPASTHGTLVARCILIEVLPRRQRTRHFGSKSSLKYANSPRAAQRAIVHMFTCYNVRANSGNENGQYSEDKIRFWYVDMNDNHR